MNGPWASERGEEEKRPREKTTNDCGATLT